MVVTPSLARGAVREAVRVNGAKWEGMHRELQRTRIKAPPTFRRFGDWFRTYRRIHEQVSILIICGLIGRRRGALTAFNPLFIEVGQGWVLKIQRVSLEITPGRVERFDSELLPVTIDGHALERMFQRTDSIKWSVVRDCLATAIMFMNTAIHAYGEAGCKQCALPAEKGLLVGEVVEGELALNTYLSATTLQPKWDKLLSDINIFGINQKDLIHVSALTGNVDAGVALTTVLGAGKHKWLLDPYARGVDRMEEAWRSRDTAEDL